MRPLQLAHLLLAVKLGARGTVHSLLRGHTGTSRVPGLWVSHGKVRALGRSSCGSHTPLLGTPLLTPAHGEPWRGSAPPHAAKLLTSTDAHTPTLQGQREPSEPTDTSCLPSCRLAQPPASPGRSTWLPSRWKLYSDWPASSSQRGCPHRASGRRGALLVCGREGVAGRDRPWASGARLQGPRRESRADQVTMGLLPPGLHPDPTATPGRGVHTLAQGPCDAHRESTVRTEGQEQAGDVGPEACFSAHRDDGSRPVPPARPPPRQCSRCGGGKAAERGPEPSSPRLPEGPGPRLLGLWLVDLSGAAGSAKVVDGRGASWPWGLLQKRDNRPHGSCRPWPGRSAPGLETG